MIKLDEFMQAAEAVNLTPVIDAAAVYIKGGYVSDMLSDVMGSARSGDAWITIMIHMNVIAVASITGISVIVFAKSANPDAAVIEKAASEGICLLSSNKPSFELAGILYQMLQR